MANLVPHISFNGNCEEAMNFYKKAFGGEIAFMMTYKGSPMEDKVADDYQAKIMHSSFEADGVVFMAADTMPGLPAPETSNIDLNINFDSKETQLSVFSKLSEGGKIKMPLQDTFWGSHFGMVKDSFGIGWMLSCELGKA